MRAPLDVMSDGSERVRYDRPGFALFARRTRLSDYPEGRILCHWHDDLELICVREGRLCYEVDVYKRQGHFREVGALAAQEVAHGGVALAEEVDILCGHGIPP